MRSFHLFNGPPVATLPAPSPVAAARSFSAAALHTERDIGFHAGETFFRPESATGRDLGVLAAALHRRASVRLRVLDAMCGCDVRSLRYLDQSGADFIWANDANDETRRTILANLGRQARFGEDGRRRWVVTHSDANRVMMESFMRRELFDFIDINSFGSESAFLRPAFDALSFGGLLYLTSTDGYSSGGHRPQHSLASYGAYVRPMPYANEIGLRALIGGALREAATLDYYVSPLFSYYASRHHGFTGYCKQCGNSRSFSWSERCFAPAAVTRFLIHWLCQDSGPLWTGPLHDGEYLINMLNLAKEWGWTETIWQGRKAVRSAIFQTFVVYSVVTRSMSPLFDGLVLRRFGSMGGGITFNLSYLPRLGSCAMIFSLQLASI